MMKPLFLFFIFLIGFTGIALSQAAKELHENAKASMNKRDFNNAEVLLIRALEQLPFDPGVTKDLALTYYFQKKYAKSLEAIKILLDKPDVDDQSFQIAGIIYKALDLPKEAEIMYKKAIKIFANSGVLYNEYGELLSAMQNPASIIQWEKGIEMDPGYPGNYYNAARHYYFTTDKIWSIIYSEIFINIDPLSARMPEVKGILLDSYKKLFSTDFVKNLKGKNTFEQAFLQSMNKVKVVAEKGINVESLIMIRTRFVLDWFEKYAAKFPVRLFEYHQQLLREGIFPAYNQWIFGSIQNLMAYQNWITSHAAEYADFRKFQNGRIFKIPQGQYYHK